MKRHCTMYVAHNKLLTGISGIVAFIILLAAVDIQAAELPPLTHNLTRIENPWIAPALRLEDMDNQIVDISELRGKVVVVNFWATWCPPCRREMASLENLHRATADKGVAVLAVNIGEDIDTVFPFMGTLDPSPTFPILFDYDAHSLAVWEVRGLPTTFIVDPDGFVVYRAVGGREFDHPELLGKILDLHNKSRQ